MRRALAAVLWLSMASSAAASSDSSLVVARVEAPPVAEFIEVPADFVSLSIEVTSDADAVAERIREMQATRAALLAETKASGDVEITPGLVSITPRAEKSWGSSYEPESKSLSLISAPLGETTSVFAATQRIHALVAKIKPVGEARIRLGATSLSVRSPERFRDDLLRRIKESVASTRKALGASGTVDVGGLEGPVRVSQKDDRTVRVYLDYTITLHY